ncbi:hypothetical protein [Streptococcus jiangjianxini]|uniref:hypothetical protein n=1 Tax=Streptococcus jiangjianxini TaxID=3161189 RepID=UPI0032EFE27E
MTEKRYTADDLKVTLSSLAIISDMALSTDDSSTTYATLNVANMLLKDVVNRLEEVDSIE